MASIPHKSPKRMSAPLAPDLAGQLAQEGRIQRSLRKHCMKSLAAARSYISSLPSAPMNDMPYPFQPLRLSRKTILLKEFPLLIFCTYSRQTFGLGTPWQAISTVSRLSYSFRRYSFSPAIWQPVPTNSTDVSDWP